MRIFRLGAFDIGTNAVRSLITTVSEYEGKLYFKKTSLVRYPVRLGEDVFMKGEISLAKQEALTSAVMAFKYLTKVYQVSDHRLVATSAMREAKNGQALALSIYEQTQFKIDIISGKEEADMIYSTQFLSTLNPERHYLYIDVGGGSTELTLIFDNKPIHSESFKIGTIRYLRERIEQSEWDRCFEWIHKNVIPYKAEFAIGSGGNINTISKRVLTPNGKFISLDNLKLFLHELEGTSYEHRIIHYNMNPDRADVVIPAASIFTEIMHTAKLKKLRVPKIGLVDGIVADLARKVFNI